MRNLEQVKQNSCEKIMEFVSTVTSPGTTRTVDGQFTELTKSIALIQKNFQVNRELRKDTSISKSSSLASKTFLSLSDKIFIRNDSLKLESFKASSKVCVTGRLFKRFFFIFSRFFAWSFFENKIIRSFETVHHRRLVCVTWQN